MCKEHYNRCPYCGARLDPEEHCDCPEAIKERKHITKTEEKENG